MLELKRCCRTTKSQIVKQQKGDEESFELIGSSTS